MKNWFHVFEKSLKGSPAPSDLIGAGSADAERALRHYRFQHEAKLKEVVADTFPSLLKFLGEDWDQLWDEFHAQNESSPRNLDWFPELFLNFFQKSSHPVWLKELARFEHILDVHPWTHPALSLKTDLVPGENSRIHLGKYQTVSFEAPVVDLYEDEVVADTGKFVTLIFWQKEDGTYYRAMEEWELALLSKLHLGVEEALEVASGDAEKVGTFFQWLGSSCLIQSISPA